MCVRISNIYYENQDLRFLDLLTGILLLPGIVKVVSVDDGTIFVLKLNLSLYNH